MHQIGPRQLRSNEQTLDLLPCVPSAPINLASICILPSRACPSPTADLNSCSNFAWSVAVKNDRRILGILVSETGALAAGTGGPGVDAGVDANDWAI